MSIATDSCAAPRRWRPRCSSEAIHRNGLEASRRAVQSRGHLRSGSVEAGDHHAAGLRASGAGARRAPVGASGGAAGDSERPTGSLPPREVVCITPRDVVWSARPTNRKGERERDEHTEQVEAAPARPAPRPPQSAHWASVPRRCVPPMSACTACGDPLPPGDLSGVCEDCRAMRIRVKISRHGLCPCSRGKCRPRQQPSRRVECIRCLGRITEKKNEVVTKQQARSRAFHQQQGTGRC